MWPLTLSLSLDNVLFVTHGPILACPDYEGGKAASSLADGQKARKIREEGFITLLGTE
jgi:hypothetical protein